MNNPFFFKKAYSKDAKGSMGDYTLTTEMPELVQAKKSTVLASDVSFLYVSEVRLSFLQ